MLNIDINITNSFVKEDFQMLWFGFIPLSKNKTIEFQFNRVKGTILSIETSILWHGRDHAGPHFEFGLFGWSFIVSIPDSRHWDYQNKTWKI
jgi:hypothetical protein